MTRYFKIFALCAVASAGGFVSSGASATTNSSGQSSCTTSGYSTTYDACSGNTASASSTVTSSEAVAIGTAQTVGLVSGRISALAGSRTGGNVAYNDGKGRFSYNLGFDEDGKSAGGAEQKVGVWVAGNWSRTIYDKNDDTSYDGDTTSGMLGADYRIDDNVLVGLAAGYESTELATAFNEGSEDSDGWTGALYALFDIDKTFSVDVTAGYSWLDYDMKRKDPLIQTTITGKTDASRAFGALNVNGDWVEDNWALGAHIGTLYAREKKDAFTESGEGYTSVAADTTTLGRARIGGDIGYMFDYVTPYAKATYNYDYNDGGSSDSDSLDYGLGIRFDGGNGISGVVEGTGVAFKDDLQNYGVTAAVRVEF